MRVLTVIGARPQFIKAGPVSTALKKLGVDELIVHTGQHYDRSMSQVFFDELQLKPPDINLNVGSGSHGIQTGVLLAAPEHKVPSCTSGRISHALQSRGDESHLC